jgi:hypothetical protein
VLDPRGPIPDRLLHDADVGDAPAERHERGGGGGELLQDVGDSIDECRKSPEAYRGWCYVGVAKNFIDLTATTGEGFEFCRAVEEEAKPRCNEAIGEQIYVLFGDPEERRAACAEAESEELGRSCLRGARVQGDG